jgi:hypothetical protein
MKKLVREPVTPLYQYFCDATGEQISPCTLFDSLNDPAICDIIGCTIKFNADYGGLVDSIPELSGEFHLSQKVTREFLSWLEEKYPESPLITSFKEHQISF